MSTVEPGSLLLSATASVGGLEIVRDAAFATLGFLSDPQPGMLTFVAGRPYLEALRRSPGVSCVLTLPELAPDLDFVPGLATCADPQAAFVAVHSHLALTTDFYGERFPSRIDPTARIHSRAWVAEHNVRVGPRAVIGPGAMICERSSIDAEATIHPGAVIGASGFQLMRREGRVHTMVHCGEARILERAAVYANAVIAAGLFRVPTVVGEDTQVGNLAFVSHSTRIGRASFLGHGSVCNGNVVIGDRVWVGPNATISNNLVLGDEAFVCLGAVVLRDVAARERILGVAAAHELSRGLP